jgi:hypothetical protein
MEIENLIQVEHFCLSHEIETSFVHSLHSLGLVEITTIETTHYIAIEQTADLEKMLRMHFELGINMEGIDVISNLLHKITSLQEELRVVKNRLSLYEEE